jgi:hypothetical protein
MSTRLRKLAVEDEGSFALFASPNIFACSASDLVCSVIADDDIAEFVAD